MMVKLFFVSWKFKNIAGFQKTISHRHYSLGEATEYSTRWLQDPNHFPNGPHPEIGSRAPLMRGENNTSLSHKRIRQHLLHSTTTRSRNPIRIYHTTTSPKQMWSNPAEPDDTMGILDSGAMMTTATRRHLSIHHHWLENIRPATPGTSILNGNMKTEPVVEEQGHIGSYQLSVVPDRFRTALICVHATGHSVTLNQQNTIISDNGAA